MDSQTTEQVQAAHPSDSTVDRTDAYYSTMAEMQRAIADRDYSRAAELAIVNMRHIPGWIARLKDTTHERIPPVIPALEIGGTMMAIVGQERGLHEMMTLVQQVPDLSERAETIQRHFSDMQCCREIKRVVAQNPGCMQTSMKAILAVPNARRLAVLIQWLEKDGSIVRRRKGRAYELYSKHDAPLPRMQLPSVAMSLRTDDPEEPRLLDLDGVEQIAAQLSDKEWKAHCYRESDYVRQRSDQMDGWDEMFCLVESPGWSLGEAERIRMRERPDPAFRRLHACRNRIFCVDDLANAEEFPNLPGAALCYDRLGNLRAKKPLLSNVYRMQAHPMGTGIVAMSKDCILHAYDSLLEPVFRTSLDQAPEMRYGEARLEGAGRHVRYHIRVVAMSPGLDAYLFSLHDMAWCIDVNSGKARWGLRMPIKAGWREHPGAASGGDVPVSKRYSSVKDEQSWQIPVDLSEVDGVDMRFTIRLDTAIRVDEAWVADRINCATFSARGNCVYVGTVSGKVVQVNRDGSPVRVFNIVGVPTRIIHTGEWLYVVTRNRLVIMSESEVVDVIGRDEKAEVIVVPRGLGLLGTRELRWFAPDGKRRGAVLARHPIRRAYWRSDALVVETRQHRVRIGGVEPWWLACGS